MFSSSFRLGRIAGIEVAINYSLLLIGALVVWQVGDLILPNQVPGYSQATYLIFGGITALLFFASILWHELAHGLMARFYKVRVRRIVLFFLGGVAEIEDEPANAGQEFWIAFVGPLSSAILGGIFWGMRALAGQDTLPEATLYWLSTINLFLAAFNMLPGFPLDGGRVLRAFLWWLTGNHLRATRLTSYVGQFMAYAVGVAGIISIFVPQYYLGEVLWNFLLAWFLLHASRSHLRSAQMRERLQGVPIGQLVQGTVPVKAEWPLAYAADIIAMGGPLSALPVMRDGRLVGVLSVDFLRNLPRMGWNRLRVADVMQPIHSVRTVEASRDVYDALRDSDLNDQRYLLVMNQQSLVGLLSQRELMAFAEQQVRAS